MRSKLFCDESDQLEQRKDAEKVRKMFALIMLEGNELWNLARLAEAEADPSNSGRKTLI